MKQKSVFQESLLIIIDMQEAFQRPGVQWECVGYDTAAAKVTQLRNAHQGSAVWTQFIRDPTEHGAWQAYYDRWDQYRIEPQNPLWDLTLVPQPADVTLQASTFGKWGAELSAIAQAYDHLTVAGVATDCCVLSTVLPAVDAGKHLTVVSDACAGASLEVHDQALNLMGMLAPMVTIATADEITSQ